MPIDIYIYINLYWLTAHLRAHSLSYYTEWLYDVYFVISFYAVDSVFSAIRIWLLYHHHHHHQSQNPENQRKKSIFPLLFFCFIFFAFGLVLFEIVTKICSNVKLTSVQNRIIFLYVVYSLLCCIVVRRRSKYFVVDFAKYARVLCTEPYSCIDGFCKTKIESAEMNLDIRPSTPITNCKCFIVRSYYIEIYAFIHFRFNLFLVTVNSLKQ